MSGLMAMGLMAAADAGVLPVSSPSWQTNYGHGTSYGERGPNDAIGSCELRLNNIVSGSRWRVEVASTGALAASPGGDEEGVAATDPEVLTLYLYPAGNPLNDVRIKVRKGTSAQKYLPFETLITLAAGGVQTGVSAYVAQVADSVA